jgi:mannose-6-phosphate isomerase-like protein (cupin superfamily)
MLRRGDVPHLMTFARATFLPRQGVRAHAHGNMSEVFFVERGEGLLRVGGAEQPLAPGVCVAVLPDEEHEVFNDGRDELVLLYFGVES